MLDFTTRNIFRFCYFNTKLFLAPLIVRLCVDCLQLRAQFYQMERNQRITLKFFYIFFFLRTIDLNFSEYLYKNQNRKFILINFVVKTEFNKLSNNLNRKFRRLFLRKKNNAFLFIISAEEKKKEIHAYFFCLFLIFNTNSVLIAYLYVLLHTYACIKLFTRNMHCLYAYKLSTIMFNRLLYIYNYFSYI